MALHDEPSNDRTDRPSQRAAGSLPLQTTSWPCLDPYAADVHLDMVAYLEYALLLQYLSPLDSAGFSVSLLPGPSGRSSRCLVLLRRRAQPQTASQTASPRSLAIQLDHSPPPH